MSIILKDLVISSFVVLPCIYFIIIFYYCPRRDFAQKAKSRGGTLVTRAYIKESTYSSNIQSYSQYRKNLDLLQQGPRGISR